MRLPKTLLQAITFPILPPMSDGSCGCGDRTCKNSGKHPAVKWGAKSLAPGESSPIPEGFNTGLATGARSNVLVVDLDRKNGVDGLLNLMALGVISVETLAACTPTGGYHLYFRHPGVHIPNSASLLGPGIDIRGDGGYVVIPDSRHKNGGVYTWLDENAEITECPQWLLDLILNPKTVERVIKRETLERIAKSWKKSKSVYRQELGVALLAVCKGESFADAGSRDNALWELVSELPKILPNADLEKLALLFVPSLDLMEHEAPDAPTVETVLEKLERVYGDAQSNAAGAWTARLATNQQGMPKGTLGNVNIVISNHHLTSGLVVYDERRGREVLTRTPPWSSPEDMPAPRDVTDADAIHMTTWLAETLGIDVNSIICREAINGEAQLHRFDKVRTYLEELVWDGVPRLDTWLNTYAGVVDNEYTRAVAAKFMISAVARALKPGCKVDTMIILEGDQGELKSTLLRTLFGTENFRDDMPDLESKDAKAYLRGPWGVEIKELGAFDRTHANAIKGFIDQQADSFRPAYGSKTIDFPRRNVFAGTTNARTYLKDPTGNRRYWPVRVIRIDIDGLTANRDQLWAEAVARYLAGEQWWLNKEQSLLAGEEQAEREEDDDTWLPIIVVALEVGTMSRGQPDPNNAVNKNAKRDWAIPPKAESVMIGVILEHVFDIEPGRATQAQQNRVARVLQKIGWLRKQKKVFGVRTWAYFRPSHLRLVKDGEG